MLGFTCLTNGDAWAVALTAAIVKQEYPELPILIGGYFPTCNSIAMLNACPAIDAAVVGEGEVPTTAILQRMADGLPPFSTDVPGLCFRADGQMVSTPRPAPFDLSSAPPLNFRILENPERYRTLTYHTSRNCPWRCSYCLEVHMGTRYRIKPLDVVRHDVEEFSKLNPSFVINLTDPVFSLSGHRTVQLCEMFGELHARYSVQTRCDMLNPKLVPILKKSGCVCIYTGMESASYETLLRMNKLRSPDFETYQKYLDGALAIAEASGANCIHLVIGAMLGYPGDTSEDIKTTLEFCHRMRDTFGRSLPNGGCGAALAIAASGVFIPRESAIWRTREYYARKGLRIADTSLFGQHFVANASFDLDEEKLQAFEKEFHSVSWGETPSRPLALASIDDPGWPPPLEQRVS